ncbi:MAG: hypothetical protein WA003_15795 [Desulfuromonadaceae bacterium]
MPARILFEQGQVETMKACYLAGSSCCDISARYGVAKNTIRKVLLANGIVMDKGRSISTKVSGRPSKRKGTRCSDETRAKMRAIDRSNYKTTAGRVFTEEQRQHMRDAWEVKRALRPKIIKPEKVILTAEEVSVRARQRTRYKNLYRRLISASGKRKCIKTEAALGYTRDEFVSHIESQFRDGMSWSDRESFHIDHIIPVDAFTKAGIFDPREVNALSNLQPLYPIENRKKSNILPLGIGGTRKQLLTAVKRGGATVYMPGII